MTTKKTPTMKQLRNKSFSLDRRIIKLIKESRYAKPRRLNTIRRQLRDLYEQADDAFNNIIARSTQVNFDIFARAYAITHNAVNADAYATDDINAVQDWIKYDIVNNDVNDMWDTVSDIIDYDVQQQYNAKANADNQFPSDLLNIGEQPLISRKHEQQTYKAQQQIVNKVMKQLRANPVNWQLDLDDLSKILNDYGKTILFKSLHKFFIKVIGRLPIDKKYFIKYYITSWHSKSFTSEECNKLLNAFINQSLVYSVEQQHVNQESADNLVSDSDNGVLPNITLFTKLQFV